MTILSEVDLIVDHVYGGSREGNAADDPFPKLLGVDSGAGFRHLGPRPGVDTLKLLALITNLRDPDWPDNLDKESGLFTYYGDNKKPREIHDTPRQGNQILRNLFDAAHDPTVDRFPVILVFASTGEYRDTRFLGVAVPGAESIGPDDDLVAIWRTSGPENIRFQNYRSIFTILDIPKVTRAWLEDIKADNALNSDHAPEEWRDWVKFRRYRPLRAPNSIEIRDKTSQTPSSKEDKAILEAVYDRFKDNPYDFEKCAVEIARLMMPAIGECELTRPWRDGGRDAIGNYKVGRGNSAIDVEFALEAKCYKYNNGVGVKELSRLISRLRHRQFGILVTTSYLAQQAYKEVKEDGHPVVVISGTDIVEILRKRKGGIDQIKLWLDSLDH